MLRDIVCYASKALQGHFGQLAVSGGAARVMGFVGGAENAVSARFVHFSWDGPNASRLFPVPTCRGTA